MNQESDQEIIDRQRAIEQAVIKHRITRFWMLLCIQMYMGTLLLAIPDSRYPAAQGYLLDQIGLTHHQYGIAYLLGGLAMMAGSVLGSRTMRIVHAALSGCFGGLAIILLAGLFGGYAIASIGSPLFMLVAWQHKLAGQASDSLFRRKPQGDGSR